jgi:hypothetical protein
MKYLKRKVRPALKQQHKEARVTWAAEHVSWTQQWKRVIFSDEKKFNLDGPDGCQYYWHDLRTEPQYFSKRVQGGGSLMVWAGFCFNGKTPIAFLRGRQNAECYQQVLQHYLVPHGRRLAGPQWIFQQDNAPIHTALTTKKWLQDHNTRLLDWPSRSPDLNPIENLWGSLVRRVYTAGKQFETTAELKVAIEAAWAEIEAPELQDLVNSMPRRMIEVLKANGSSIRF